MSSRFGPENKLTSLLNGVPLVRYGVEAALAAGAETWVVTGHDAEGVERCLQGLPVRFAYNSRYQLGIGTSIAMGVRASDKDSAGYLIIPGDMPRIDPITITKMVTKMSGPAGIVTLSDGVRQSSPTIFGSDYRVPLCHLRGDQGAKAIVQLSNRVEVLLVSPDELWDLDVPGGLP